jgi:hypothetical protein
MEITEYLANSRLKRQEMMKTAQSYLHKTVSNDIGNSPLTNETEGIYAGPNPAGLKQFENLVGNQLKKIFSPGEVVSQKQKIVSSRTVDEKIRKTYSRNKQPFKKKQLVMIPKQHNAGFLRIPKFVSHAKNFSVSPEIIPEAINKSWSRASKEPPYIKRSAKENLLFPILSTAGSHEYRSKLYKY